MNTKLDLGDRVNDLIIKYLTEDITSDELEFLRNWINESLKNKELFNNLKSTWNMAVQDTQSIDYDSGKAFLDLESKIFGERAKGTKSSIFLFIRKYAAVGLLFLILGGAVSWFVKPSYQTYNNLRTVINAPLGAKSVLRLPDGSRIWLNAGSTIEYRPDFGKDTRTVYLKGEAYFSVAKNLSKPFLVKTGQMVVKALGTRFNVKAYPEEKTITTTLEEGKIEVETLLNDNTGGHLQKILLNPKEKIVYFKQIETPTIQNEIKKTDVVAGKEKKSKPMIQIELTENVNTILYTSWKDERWILESEPLGSLGTIMERRFHITVVFEQEELKDYRFTGAIENEPLEQILNAFKLTAPIDYKIIKDTVYFTLNKSLKERYNKIIKY